MEGVSEGASVRVSETVFVSDNPFITSARIRRLKTATTTTTEPGDLAILVILPPCKLTRLNWPLKKEET